MSQIDVNTAHLEYRHDTTRIAAQFGPSQRPNSLCKETQGRIGDLDVTMEATKSAEPKDSKRQHNELDRRYGKIGISAVAAAVSQLREQQTVGEYRIPFDRD
jgi:hypothetical protein